MNRLRLKPGQGQGMDDAFKNNQVKRGLRIRWVENIHVPVGDLIRYPVASVESPGRDWDLEIRTDHFVALEGEIERQAAPRAPTSKACLPTGSASRNRSQKEGEIAFYQLGMCPNYDVVNISSGTFLGVSYSSKRNVTGMTSDKPDGWGCR